MIYYFFVLLILVGVVIAILMAKLPSKQAANLLRWVLGVGCREARRGSQTFFLLRWV